MAVDLAPSAVRDLMTASVPVITPRTAVGTALRLLREHAVPALPVAEGGRYLGVVDEAALLRLTPSEATTLDVYEMHDQLARLTVARIVARDVPALSPAAPLREAARAFAQSGARALPVVEDGRLVGLVVWTALLATL